MEVRLRVDQVWGRIGLAQTFPSLKLSVSQPALDLEVRMPKLELTPDRVELSLDYEACRADLNMYDAPDFARVQAARAREIVAEAVARAAAEGDRLAAIETGEQDAIAEIARERALEERVEVELASRHLPEISSRVVKGEKSFVPGGVEVGFLPGQVKTEFEWGRVRVYWLRMPQIRIEAVRAETNILA